MIFIQGGNYAIGTNDCHGHPDDREGPSVTVTVDSFYIDETAVTNEAFMTFINATHYQTDAQRCGWSFVFDGLLPPHDNKIRAQNTPWWVCVEGACWNHPEGPHTTIDDRMDHPVVHVSRNDAVAYCQWANKRLPTEAEWEIAAKGGTDAVCFPWGDTLVIDGNFYANTWQGAFPEHNTAEDGYRGTAPADAFYTNAYGIHQMLGNVWEWCVNPQGMPLDRFNDLTGSQLWQGLRMRDDRSYAMKGGSFLCHESYCNRYRIAARTGNTGCSSSSNVGFRCVKDYMRSTKVQDDGGELDCHEKFECGCQPRLE